MTVSPLILGNGDLRVSPPVVLAPLAGITNGPFRMACRRGGAGMVWSEMVSARALAMNDRKTREMMRPFPGEGPLAVQVFGRDPSEVAAAAALAGEMGAALVDINMGCPVRKVLKGGAGAQLLREPALAGELVRAAVRAAAVPVTAKIRLGWDEADLNFLDLGRRLADEGAAAVTLHARTRAQGFTGKARWEKVGELVRALPIPVIGNGDVRSREDALALLGLFGCAAVMVGRGSLGRPWIFREISGEPPARGGLSREEILCFHLEDLSSHLPGTRSVGHLRKHLGWYSRSCPESAAFRGEVHRTADPRALVDRARQFFRLPPRETGESLLCASAG